MTASWSADPADSAAPRLGAALAVALAVTTATLAGERIEPAVADRLAALSAPGAPGDVFVLTLPAATVADAAELAGIVADLAGARVAAIGLDLPADLPAAAAIGYDPSAGASPDDAPSGVGLGDGVAAPGGPAAAEAIGVDLPSGVGLGGDVAASGGDGRAAAAAGPLAAAVVGAGVPVVVAAGRAPHDIAAAVRTGTPLALGPSGLADTLPRPDGRPPFALALSEAGSGPAVMPAGRIVFAAEPIRTAPASPLLWPMRLAGATVVVGAGSDRLAVPPGVPGAQAGTMPRAAIDAHVLAQVRAQRERHEVPEWGIPLAALAGAIAAAALPRRGLRRGLALAGVPLGFAATAVGLAAGSIVVPVLTPLLAFALAAGIRAVLPGSRILAADRDPAGPARYS